MTSRMRTLLGLCLCCCFLQTACDRQTAEKENTSQITSQNITQDTSENKSVNFSTDTAMQNQQTPSITQPAPQVSEELAAERKAIIGASDIPYPVYPNGSKYRVGGENGLKIVLYQTHDSFEDVDRFYKSKAQDIGMPRLAAMSDYVRYTISGDDQDPWETEKPGIVIHRFNDDNERSAVGAEQGAQTNIIMSF